MFTEKLRVCHQPVQEEAGGRSGAEEEGQSNGGQEHDVHAAEYGPGGGGCGVM